MLFSLLAACLAEPLAAAAAALSSRPPQQQQLRRDLKPPPWRTICPRFCTTKLCTKESPAVSLSLSLACLVEFSPPLLVHNCIYQQTHKTKTKTVAVAGRQTGTSVFFASLWICTLCVISALLCRQQGTRVEQGRRIEDRRSKKEEGGRGGELGVIENSRFSWRLWGKSWFWLLVRFSCCVWRRRRGGRRGAEGKYS